MSIVKLISVTFSITITFKVEINMQNGGVDHEKLQKLHQLALESRSRAYCPYSNFAVGSCIIGGNGKYYTGCNVENAVSSCCA